MVKTVQRSGSMVAHWYAICLRIWRSPWSNNNLQLKNYASGPLLKTCTQIKKHHFYLQLFVVLSETDTLGKMQDMALTNYLRSRNGLNVYLYLLNWNDKRRKFSTRELLYISTSIWVLQTLVEICIFSIFCAKKLNCFIHKKMILYH